MWIEQRVCPFVKFLKDRLSIKYEGKGLLYTDAAAIQANKCLDPGDMVGYFEVKVNNIGQRGDLSVGLTDTNFPQNKLPGMTKQSLGYKSDGKLYHNKKPLTQIHLPILGSGDVIGCGINFYTN